MSLRFTMAAASCASVLKALPAYGGFSPHLGVPTIAYGQTLHCACTWRALATFNLMILTAPGNDTRMYRTIDSSAEKKLPSVFKMPAGPLGILLRRRTAGFLA
jgi:hypothetical protein